VILFSYLVLSVTEKNPLDAFLALALAGFVTAMIFLAYGGMSPFCSLAASVPSNYTFSKGVTQ
jgi:hypothetical protein